MTESQLEHLNSSPAASHWSRIGVKPHHGFNVPLFSLRTEESCGVGEYPDLILLAEWCAKLGMDVIQLLPLNDTGQDISPYSALSAFALNPLYLRLTDLPDYACFPQAKEILETLRELDHLQRIDYSNVRTLKRNFLGKYFYTLGKNQCQTADFTNFCNENPWLKPYALFKTLKEYHNWWSWELWEEEIKYPTLRTYEKLLIEHEEEIAYHCFVQYHCFKQLKQAKQHANTLNVLLKGDLPIMISRESADVWFHHSLFNLEFTAGAPPDMYAVNGQNWGFPIYNWDNMREDNHAWWRQRLKTAEALYDIYRLDHVVGFYRIWAIAPGKTGREGAFIPENRDEQMALGERSMRMMLDASPLLPIGEDLGTVPLEVREKQRLLGICGTKVMRWERYWEGDKTFIPIDCYIPESMTTVSTHDSETLRQWWENQSDEVREYCAFKNWEFRYELQKDKRFEILYDSHHTSSLFHINLLQEYLALVTGMTWLGINEERINVPGKILAENWTYRYRPTLEEMSDNEELNEAIKLLLE